jgi:uncharacterized protein (TIRG00374 family)
VTTAVPADPTPARARKVLIKRLLGSAIMLSLLLIVVPRDDIATALRRVPPQIWLVALTVYLTLHLIGVYKWMLLINTAGAGLSFAQTARCYYYGLFGNIFLPSIIGGDVVRAGLAMRMTRSKSGLLLGSLADRLIDTVGLAGVAGIGALLLPTALDPRSRAIFLGLAALFAVLGIAGAASLMLLPIVRRLPFKRRRTLVKMRQAIRTLGQRPGRLVSALLLGMLLQGLLVMLNAWLGDIVGIHISPVVWLFVWPLAKIAAILPLTQGGIGVREGAMVILFQPFGVPAAAAMATALIFTTVVMAGGLIGGAAAYLLGRLDGVPLRGATTLKPT